MDLIKRAFMKKKKEEEIPKVEEPVVEEPTEETPDLEVTPEELEKETIEEDLSVKPEPELPGEFIRILSGDLLDGGLVRYVVVANKSLGAIGEIIDLEK